ncbi:MULTISPECIES: UDP-4-amino-4,6-dideoxy-N-acetyl-beta-L-altrosamine transaminase [unclassified Agarivorans]|uniref:UDP-4-amino-4, 6-dideoxy-N-acetyl-beta-L-altrosamine transaminase n=1 Tax=unclassified Agarivorans TaxID=2636026 RepID=UPI0026E2F17B|nr:MULTISPECIES: UDP-4-amino-4,6-dideoxy-N-acetyl-beta-L-altrosamine transaminase [unclassified Agarivorans]MDO6684709.1 UDP-4-amino-4,6-dideoxy-N-acetyl-beta-L-altrosamine transaminase [Agarivorans sp. 3_MG-2023]MDO6715130.1 UDP-4-amino-4,6-dideoxy-N-acetyl-beta-L-altrosamine transaminase [Agarivorans sp. 2_MG-2023]
MIPYGRQQISQQDIDTVVEVLGSDYLTQGPKVPEFEQALCTYTGAKYTLATNSATSALHLACRALDVSAGDIVWTSPITFVASANCALYCGAEVDFVDIDSSSYNLCPLALKTKLEKSTTTNSLPKVVIVIHMCGQPCDMQAIYALSQQYGFRIIEDASHAIGGTYLEHPIGNCRFSDITVFSFHPVKIITTGEGGAALTNSLELSTKMALLRSHGVTRDPALMTKEPDGPWFYQQLDLGFNYRITELQGALGLSQLKRVDQWVAKRAELANRYDELLTPLPVISPKQHTNGISARHLYVIQLSQPEKRLAVFNKMQAADIGVNVHYIPVHTQPHYQALGHKLGDYPNAEHYYKAALSLPLFPALTDEEQKFVVSTLAEALQ